MPARQRLRTMTVVLFGILGLTLGSTTSSPAQVAAATHTRLAMPATDVRDDERDRSQTPPDSNDFDIDLDELRSHLDELGSHLDELGRDERVEKTERLGGRLTTEIIDLVAGVIKCGLNIATPSVSCPL
ncbi:hypothetical protein [Nocardia sp. CNY236]|uniref:hypothetical protein n=1 Tax=Nocardia sp. CNY236 TaxID=1169152 RepID=UPI000410C086|nr:hypothetical protein [Nocardia sp. CNY236]